MNDIAISARGLTRYFGTRPIVQDLDLTIYRGSITGLLGLNGAGKTTTIRMLLGILEPTRGTCEVLGVASQQLTPEVRSRIGHTVEGHFLYPWMRVRDCERFHRDTQPRWERSIFDSTVNRFGIEQSARCSQLSRGQRAGVSLALMLAADPELLILDDPAMGLDPVSRRALNETILDFADGGRRTVLLSSHLLDDVERVVDQVLVMVDGQLVVDAALDELRNRVSAWSLRLTDASMAYRAVPGLIHRRQAGAGWILTVADADRETEAALERLGATDVQRIDTSFEDIVMAYLARSRRGESFLVPQEF